MKKSGLKYLQVKQNEHAEMMKKAWKKDIRTLIFTNEFIEFLSGMDGI